MPKIINFNKKRKAKVRLDKEQKASENRIRFGRSKKEKNLEQQINERNKRFLDNHKLEEDDKN